MLAGGNSERIKFYIRWMVRIIMFGKELFAMLKEHTEFLVIGPQQSRHVVQAKRFDPTVVIKDRVQDASIYELRVFAL